MTHTMHLSLVHNKHEKLYFSSKVLIHEINLFCIKDDALYFLNIWKECNANRMIKEFNVSNKVWNEIRLSHDSSTNIRTNIFNPNIYKYKRFSLWIRTFLSYINYKFKIADEKKVHLKNRLSMSDAIKINSFH